MDVSQIQYISQKFTGVDPQIGCDTQPTKIIPCIRGSKEGCETCTHYTYMNECRAVPDKERCSNDEFRPTSGECMENSIGGWRCFEEIDVQPGNLDL